VKWFLGFKIGVKILLGFVLLAIIAGIIRSEKDQLRPVLVKLLETVQNILADIRLGQAGRRYERPGECCGGTSGRPDFRAWPVRNERS